MTSATGVPVVTAVHSTRYSESTWVGAPASWSAEMARSARESTAATGAPVPSASWMATDSPVAESLTRNDFAPVE